MGNEEFSFLEGIRLEKLRKGLVNEWLQPVPTKNSMDYKIILMKNSANYNERTVFRTWLEVPVFLSVGMQPPAPPPCAAPASFYVFLLKLWTWYLIICRFCSAAAVIAQKWTIWWGRMAAQTVKIFKEANKIDHEENNFAIQLQPFWLSTTG